MAGQGSEYFRGVHRVDEGFHIQWVHPLQPADTGHLQTSENAVRLRLGNVNACKSNGADKIQTASKKLLADLLARSISRQYRANLEQRYLPLG